MHPDRSDLEAMHGAARQRTPAAAPRAGASGPRAAQLRARRDGQRIMLRLA
ncbi:hypothetical protein BMA10247_A2031 [Burkholderia mallei NCTC 10247]|uniref:Uncharacterized protein n=2 Tax=Burkholderia pseudomallei TaxID=28450 RepID=A0A0E1VS13_BURPE|nr:hypothetical protein BURPS1106A_A0686 [Burkholderia pseudomallei 1106a]ABO02009.1 hypothetical protein BMA10247_A2031 [Burkholderia mallei NCTC 10247]EBA45706.1 hypothetical protein BURPS305_7764 [Burkholderia pseudomallei 305]EEH27364.1 conserved hypothetical protein [Burkholderia pseudomallei Pakistan 9]EEP51588.1 conserved hypothetical protein [Burkholderia pseudomallei MSHR346]EES22694.1 hypothetical protein BURPS1106B_1313 [Burkholderia pseudomallei 1106b]EET03663.1 hypothetical prote